MSKKVSYLVFSKKVEKLQKTDLLPNVLHSHRGNKMALHFMSLGKKNGEIHL